EMACNRIGSRGVWPSEDCGYRSAIGGARFYRRHTLVSGRPNDAAHALRRSPSCAQDGALAPCYQPQTAVEQSENFVFSPIPPPPADKTVWPSRSRKHTDRMQ